MPFNRGPRTSIITATGDAAAPPHDGPVLADEALWFEADMCGEQGFVNNDPVTSVNSGTPGITLVAPVGKRPLYITSGINSKPIVRFTVAPKDHFKISDFSQTAEATVYTVCKVPNELFMEQTNGASIDTAPGFFNDIQGVNINVHGINRGGFAFSGPADFSWFPANTAMVVRMNYVTGAAVVLHKNGVVVATSHHNGTPQGAGTTVADFYIGARKGNANPGSDADVAALIIIDRAVTAAENTMILDYLNAKYALY